MRGRNANSKSKSTGSLKTLLAVDGCGGCYGWAWPKQDVVLNTNKLTLDQKILLVTEVTFNGVLPCLLQFQVGVEKISFLTVLVSLLVGWF